MNKKDNIIIIERYERGALTAYSVDEGKTFHSTVRKALNHLQTGDEHADDTPVYDLNLRTGLSPNEQYQVITTPTWNNDINISVYRKY